MNSATEHHLLSEIAIADPYISVADPSTGSVTQKSDEMPIHLHLRQSAKTLHLLIYLCTESFMMKSDEM
jgi:hypothetical protein